MASTPATVAPPGPSVEDEVNFSDLEPAPPAPPVVAVVVAHNPGPWFDECLGSIDVQDYPSLSVLIVDAASSTDPTPRVARLLPSAYVRRLDHNGGFGPAANEVLEVVEGGSFFLFCHDDVALAPDAVRLMVEEAFRSNAGVVSPKLVAWDNSRRLLAVGLSADKTGVAAPLVERAELDQEQHDAVRDVFCAPGGCTLVRADLFRALDGFDPGIDLLGEDLDLSWRAQVLGARVVVAPAAVVRHFEALDSRRPVGDRRRLTARHRLRTTLTCYGPLHLLRVVPQAAALAVLEAIYALLAGRVSQAGDVMGAWGWNLRRLDEVRARRRHVQRLRQVPDSEVRRLQVRGSARVSAFLRGQIGHGDDRLRSVASAGRQLAGSLWSGPLRFMAGGWAVLIVVLFFGSRGLLAGDLPTFAGFPAFPTRPWTMFSHWFGGWRETGLGAEAPAPTAFALLGLGGLALFASMEWLRRLLVVVPLVLGVVGAWRMGRRAGPGLARLVTLVAFVAVPLPYDAIARGRWDGLLIWAAAPWVVVAVARLSGSPDEAGSVTPPVTARRTVVGLGLVVAVVGAFAPIMVVVPMVVAVGLVIGGVVAGRAHGGAAMLAGAAGAAGIAVILHVPWTFDFLLPGAGWSPLGGVRSADALGLDQILRFDTGPTGASFLGWLVLPAAALALVIGRDWRLEWAVRAWTVALVGWSLVWVGQRSWFSHGLGPPEAFLAPAAAALALSAGLGVAAFGSDLPGYRFGWRQLAPVVAAGSLALAVLPVVWASLDGRWRAPHQGFDSVLGFLDEEQASAGPFRTLWLGDPSLLPLGGWPIRDGLAYGTSAEGQPTVLDRWPGSLDGATELLQDALQLAETRQTSRLGRLLAPMGVRYVIVVNGATPGASLRLAATDLSAVLDEQLDLDDLAVDPSLSVFRNDAWVPSRVLLTGTPAEAARATDFFRVAAATDLRGGPPVLVQPEGAAGSSGDVPGPGTVFHAAGSSSRWTLEVDGRAVPRFDAFGWANGFTVDEGGRARLQFQTPVTRWALLALQVALWGAALRFLWRSRRRRDVALPPVEAARPPATVGAR